MSNSLITSQGPGSGVAREAMVNQAEKAAKQDSSNRPATTEPKANPVYVLNLSDEAKALSANMSKEAATQTTVEQLRASTSNTKATALNDSIGMTTKGGNRFVFRTVTNNSGNAFLLADVTTSKGESFTVMLDNSTLIKEDKAGELNFMSGLIGTKDDDILINFEGGIHSGAGDDFVLAMARPEYYDIGPFQNWLGVSHGRG